MNLIVVQTASYYRLAESGFRTRRGCLLRFLQENDRVSMINHVQWKHNFESIAKPNLAVPAHVHVTLAKRPPIPMARRMGIPSDWPLKWRAKAVTKKTKALCKEGPSVVMAFNCSALIPAREIANQLGAPLAVDFTDDMMKSPAVEEHDRELYNQAYEYAAKHADLITTNIPALTDYIVSLGGNAITLSNGVCWEDFHGTLENNDGIPDDIKTIKTPRVGMVGLLSDTVDIKLMNQVAAELDDVSFVFVGRWTDEAQKIPLHPNIHQLGFRPYDKIPAYMSAFSVGLVFYHQKATEYQDTMKLVEYLAAGKPVVSSVMHPWRSHLPDIVHATDADTFTKAIKAFLETGGDATPDERSALVKDCDWRSQTNVLLNHYENLCN